MSPIQIGNIVEGVVTGITNFGAFVLLPSGETGLIHISEVADTYVKDINEHLQKKDKVKVKILSINNEGKIGLSIRRALSGDQKKLQRRGTRSPSQTSMSFEDKIAKFMKESDERQQDIRRHTESKRGGGRSYFREGVTER